MANTQRLLHIQKQKPFLLEAPMYLKEAEESVWGAIGNYVMNSIKVFTLDDGREKDFLKMQINNNKDKIITSYENAKGFLSDEFSIVGEDTKRAIGSWSNLADPSKAGTGILGWLRGRISELGESLGSIGESLLNGIVSAATGAFNFLKGLFGSIGSEGGVFNYLKTTNIIGFPASTWLVWGVIAAFCIWLFTKLVKWFSSKEPEEQNMNETELIQQFTTYSDLLKEERLNENYVTIKVLRSAAQNAQELNQITSQKVQQKESKFWTILRKICIFLLMALGIVGVIYATGSLDGIFSGGEK